MAGAMIIPPPPTSRRLPPQRYETFIQDHLHDTRRQVKIVDIAGGLITLAAGALAYLLLVVVLDHWIAPGGLGLSARWLLLAGLVVGAACYAWPGVLRPLLYRISPVFAAHTIEQGRRLLKNSLINFVLLRQRRQELAVFAYQAIKRRAAADLCRTPVDAAVDRAPLVRRLLVLATVVIVAALYVAWSPKSVLTSLGRAVEPWRSTPAPTRVNIADVCPGDAVLYHGDTVSVSAEVTGLRDGEAVVLHSTTTDRLAVDQTIALTRTEQGHICRGTFPPGGQGLRHDLTYFLEAGDCATRQFVIEVREAPTILVDRVDYRYPAYTGLADRTVKGQGDLRAIEGTAVTIHARANRDIQRAEIDLNCDRQHVVPMNAADRTATGYLTLRLQADELRRPLYESYQLLLTDYAGQTNRRPVRHRIEVIRDLAPEVYIVKPEADEVRVRVDGRLEIHVRAVDPDFGLRRVWLRAERGKERLAIPAGLDRRPPEKVLQAPFNMSYWFVPAEFGLKPGDRVTYWAEAEDNREPEANRAETKRRRIVIVGPGDGPPPEPEPSGPVGPPIDEPPGPHGPEPPIDEPPGPPGLPRPIIEESPGPTGPPRPPRPPGPIVEEPPGPLIDEPRHPPGPSGPHGTKDPIGGGPGGPPPPPSPPAAPVPPSADDPNLDYARQQTDLTLERLKDQLAKEKRPPVELKGWVSEEARRFLELWQQWNREARRAGPEGKAARARLREEIQRLDLRVKETTRMHSRAERGPDGSQYLRDSGQFEPPGEWAEQFREYSRGVAAGEAR